MSAERARIATEDAATPRRWAWWKVSLIVAGAWAALGLLISTGAFEPPREMIEKRETAQTAIWLIVINLAIWVAASVFILWFSRRMPIVRRKFALRLIQHFFAAVALSFLVGTSMFVLNRMLTGRPFADTESIDLYLRVLPLLLLEGTLLYSLIASIGMALDMAWRTRKRDAHLARLEAQLAQARLDSLRGQLHPHFLFNTLNAIAALVRRNDAKTATETIARLSDLLRHLLSEHSSHEIPLREEISLIEEYLGIEELRFGDRLRVEFDVSMESEGCRVPTFILQPLIENAIRHGIAPDPDAGELRVAAMRTGNALTIRVENDGAMCQPTTMNGKAFGGVGLRNTRDRLRQLYGKTAHFSLVPRPGGGAVAELIVPVSVESKVATRQSAVIET